MLNRVILHGRLTKDPETRQTTSGIPVTRISVAVQRPFVDKQTNQRETDFVDCEAWRQTAEFIGRHFQKGSMILIEGSLRNNNYTDQQGVKHYGMKVMIDNVTFGEGKAQQQNQELAQQYNQQYAQAPVQQYAQAPAQAQAPVQQTVPPGFEGFAGIEEIPF